MANQTNTKNNRSRQFYAVAASLQIGDHVEDVDGGMTSLMMVTTSVGLFVKGHGVYEDAPVKEVMKQSRSMTHYAGKDAFNSLQSGGVSPVSIGGAFRKAVWLCYVTRHGDADAVIDAFGGSNDAAAQAFNEAVERASEATMNTDADGDFDAGDRAPSLMEAFGAGGKVPTVMKVYNGESDPFHGGKAMFPHNTARAVNALLSSADVALRMSKTGDLSAETLANLLGVVGDGVSIPVKTPKGDVFVDLSVIAFCRFEFDDDDGGVSPQSYPLMGRDNILKFMAAEYKDAGKVGELLRN